MLVAGHVLSPKMNEGELGKAFKTFTHYTTMLNLGVTASSLVYPFEFLCMIL